MRQLQFDEIDCVKNKRALFYRNVHFDQSELLLLLLWKWQKCENELTAAQLMSASFEAIKSVIYKCFNTNNVLNCIYDKSSTNQPCETS